MSRSYKKFPGFNDRASKKFGRNKAAKRVRHYKYYIDVSNFSWYKRLYESWNISDYSFRYYSRDQIIREYMVLNKKWTSIGKSNCCYTEEEILKLWYRARGK